MDNPLAAAAAAASTAKSPAAAAAAFAAVGRGQVPPPPAEKEGLTGRLGAMLGIKVRRPYHALVLVSVIVASCGSAGRSCWRAKGAASCGDRAGWPGFGLRSIGGGEVGWVDGGVGAWVGVRFTELLPAAALHTSNVVSCVCLISMHTPPPPVLPAIGADCRSLLKPPPLAVVCLRLASCPPPPTLWRPSHALGARVLPSRPPRHSRSPRSGAHA